MNALPSNQTIPYVNGYAPSLDPPRADLLTRFVSVRPNANPAINFFIMPKTGRPILNAQLPGQQYTPTSIQKRVHSITLQDVITDATPVADFTRTAISAGMIVPSSAVRHSTLSGRIVAITGPRRSNGQTFDANWRFREDMTQQKSPSARVPVSTLRTSHIAMPSHNATDSAICDV